MNLYLKHSKTKIRKGLWETNSSSVHSLVIKKESPKNLPKEVFFGLGEYGWEEGWYNGIEEKCRYLNTALYCRYVCYYDDKSEYKKYQQKISEILKTNGINATWFDISKIDEDDMYNYHIDHADELEDFISYVIDIDPNLLIQWLFNEDSVLVTDNDNNDMEITEKAREKYENNHDDYIFYTKGN